MSEPDKTPGTSVIISRERLITEAPTAMFDSAAFEHMQRVATVIYRSGFVPRSLTHTGPGDDAVELPEATVVARCVLLADQANRAGADVIGYIQATSVINGRLMHEGKLVNAIVQRRMGIRLKYRFGLWSTDHIDFPELVTDKDDLRFGEPKDPSFFHGAGERLAVRAFNPNDPQEYVEGSAGQWKTTRSGSPWSKVADWPRQLRYRAVREWARAYDPGTVLGMIADGDEEVLDIRDVTPRKSGVMERLSGEQAGDGFNADHVEREATADPKTRVAAKRAARKAAAEAAEGAPAAEELKPDEPGPDTQTAAQAAAEALGDDDLPAGLRVGSDELKDAQQHRNAEMSAALEAQGAAEVEPEPDVDDEDDAEALPPEMATFIEAVESVATFVEVKQAMATFFASATFKGMDIGQQNHVRSTTWLTLADRKEEGTFTDLPDHATDVSAFRLWIETTTDAEAIAGTLAVLEQQPGFAGKDDAFKTGIRNAAGARTSRG